MQDYKQEFKRRILDDVLSSMGDRATAGTPIKRGRMFHRARIDISILDTVSEESPTIITRLVEETGLMHLGRFGDLWQRMGLREALLDD